MVLHKWIEKLKWLLRSRANRNIKIDGHKCGDSSKEKGISTRHYNWQRFPTGQVRHGGKIDDGFRDAQRVRLGMAAKLTMGFVMAFSSGMCDVCSYVFVKHWTINQIFIMFFEGVLWLVEQKMMEGWIGLCEMHQSVFRRSSRYNTGIYYSSSYTCDFTV